MDFQNNFFVGLKCPRDKFNYTIQTLVSGVQMKVKNNKIIKITKSNMF